MLSKPDFVQKSIMVIHSYDVKNIRFHNENILVEDDAKIKNQASLHKLFAIFLIGEATISTQLIRKLQNFGVALVLLRKNLEVVSVIGGGLNGNILLREKQYQNFRDENLAVTMSKICITNKIQNQELLLAKIRQKNEILNKTANKLHSLAGSASVCENSKQLLGIEWNAAKYFFHEYYREMDWMGRYPRTKIDKNNLLLDMGYTFLFHFLEALLLLYGFDIYEGFYHRRFYQRKSLVCDIEEPFRAIIDEAMRKSFNLGQIKDSDFGFANGQYFLKWEAIKKYSQIFSKAILTHREAIYDYIYGFYRHILDPKKHQFPFYIFS